MTQETLQHIVIGLVCLWVGAASGILIAGMLHSSADADRDCYWQEVAEMLSRWAWGAAHSHNVSLVCEDKTENETLHRAMLRVNVSRLEDAS